MFTVGEIIDGKYLISDICSNSGGMGTVLFVDPIGFPAPFKMVLKYCNNSNDESLKRFRREVRLLASFGGNSKVVQVFDFNLECDPPYFVMKYYDNGDLSRLSADMINSFYIQESIFIQMIDCLQELHSRNEFHRDIKPQNFLLDGDKVVVSDFGLTTEVGSGTAFTQTSMYWGTHGYIPPEFLVGGFKNPDAPGDIFMLGKTFYVLLSKREPLYLLPEGIPSPIFHVIERCCNIDKAHRYQTLAELKQSVVAAYSVLLGRAGGVGKANQLLSAINDRIQQQNQYRVDEVSGFVEQLSLLDDSDQIRICFEIQTSFFMVIRQQALVSSLPVFLSIYEKMVESQDYSWSYAEIVANNMASIFLGDEASVPARVRALDLAIRAACYMNRFAAMDTCRNLIMDVGDENLGLQVATMLLSHSSTFVANIEPSACKSDAVRGALQQIK